MKIGKPNNPEMILIGNSAVVIILFKMSTINKNELPIKKDNGTVYLLLFPTNNLTIWGITKPTHPIEPEIDTEHATKTVAHIKKIILFRFILTPKLLASLSDKLK